MRILIIEDNRFIAETLRINLVSAGYSVDCLYSGEHAQTAIQQGEFDVILLDLELPKIGGLEILKNIRKNKIETPVFILTADDSLSNKVKGLNIGADDYLTKPFDIPEVIARINALTRRSAGRAEPIIEYKDIILNPLSREVSFKGEALELSRREFALLEFMLENKNKVMSREKLIRAIYAWDETISSNSLEVHICNLRKKLDNSYINTVRGVGYSIS